MKMQTFLVGKDFSDTLTNVLISLHSSISNCSFQYIGNNSDIWNNIIPILFPLFIITSNPIITVSDDINLPLNTPYSLVIKENEWILYQNDEEKENVEIQLIDWNIDSNKQPNLSYKDANNFNKEQLKISWNINVQEEKIQFPYQKFSMNPVMTYFNNLKSINCFSKDRFVFKPEKITYDKALENQLPGITFQSLPKKGKDPSQIALTLPYIYSYIYQGEEGSCIIQSLPSDYNEMDCITNYFSEIQRMQANVKQNKSPIEEWKTNSFGLVESCLKQRLDITNYNLHEQIYQIWKEATLFKVTLAKTIYSLFTSPNKKRILDISSGWGDRLIAALSIDCDRYLGFDPNQSLQTAYESIKNTFDIKKVCEIRPEPFEKGILKVNEKFDVILSSPPYFDFETYSKDEGQSIINYTTYSRWVNEFFLPSMREATKRLDINGYLAIHISDTGSMQYIVEILILYVLGFCKCNYMGCITSKSKIGTKRGQPIWVFQKSDKIDKEMAKRCETAFESIYKNGILKPIEEIKDLQLLKDCNVKRKAETINPPLELESFSYKNKTFKLISDKLFGGSKTRLLSVLMKKIDKNEIVYAGPDTGMAQIAIGYIAKIFGKKATIFVNTPKNSEKPYLVQFGEKVLGVNYKFGEGKHRPLKETESEAEKYIQEDENNREKLPFGLEGPEFVNLFALLLKEALKNIEQPKRCWIVAGSGTILQSLQKVWSDCSYQIVQVGKAIDPSKIRKGDKLYVAPEFFANNAKNQPPYDTIPWYDAKVWQFASENWNEGDVIWNVGVLPTVKQYCDNI